MAHFFSMNDLIQKLEHVWELGEAFLATYDASLLDLETSEWQDILSLSAFKQMPQDFQALNYGRAGQSFFNRYHERKSQEDLAVARRLFNEGLQHGSDASTLAILLHSLGDVLTNIYRDRSSPQALKESITYYHQAVDSLDPDDANWCAFMDDLGTALRDQYTYSGDLPPLNESINIHQRILKNAASSSNLASYFNHLGNSLFDRYRHLEQLADLQQAIAAFEQAVQRAPGEERAGYLSNLGNALSDRSNHLHSIADMERAIDLQREAVRLDPQHLFYRTNLGCELGIYYDLTGRMEDIDESITILEEVIEDTPADSPDLPDYHVNLSGSLLKRYDAQAGPEDLRRVLRHLRIALALLPDTPKQVHAQSRPHLLDASARPTYLYLLAGTLLASYGSSGRVADLREALERLREAIKQLPATAVLSQAEYRRMLSNLLLHQYDREHRFELLDEAVELAEYGTQHLPPDSPYLTKTYDALGNALRHRFLATHVRIDIQRSIAAFRQELALLPSDSPDRSITHTNLGNALRDSYTAYRDVQELEEAIAAYRLAIKLDRGDMVRNSAIGLSNLGTMLLERYDRFHRSEDLEEARIHCMEACSRGLHLAPEIVRDTARPWGNKEAALGNWDVAAQAYDYAVQAQERLYRSQLLQTEREGYLREANEIYLRAAYLMARVGQLHKAAVVLEQGRAKRLGEALERDRADLRRVEQQDPQALQRYRDAAARLRQVENKERNDWAIPGRQAFQKPVVRDAYEQVESAREELEAAIERIRQLPGLADFLPEPTYARIAAAASPAHPLAYLVVTRWGSMTLLISQSSQQPEALFRPSFRREYLRAVLAANLQDGLLILGEHLVGPLADHLRESGATGVTLVPVGVLGILPLHAARYQRGEEMVMLLDEFDVTYTPSARVLAAAQREAQSRKTEQRRLLALADPLIADPTNPEAFAAAPPPLPFAQDEVKQITALFPPPTATALYTDKATLDAFWRDVPQATIVHFACHGGFDMTNPLDATLYLAQGRRLTLRTLLDAKPHMLARLYMVVMSACESARIDPEELPDEVIGLPSGFLQAGVPLVVGTLWSVNDQSTGLLMSRFYELWLQGDPQQGLAPQSPARALRLAQRWLRDLTQDERDAYEAPSQGGRQLQTIEQKEQGKAAPEQVRPYADPFYWAAFVYYGVPLEENAAPRQQA